MSTITEDYCPKDIYRLLLEKGFDGEIHTTYDKEGYTQPSITLQMAMKWLREVHNISIEPLVDFGSGDGYWWTADVGYIKKDGLINELCGYNSYEEACEAAVKYCLKNLI